MKFISLFTIAFLTYAIQIQAAPLGGGQDAQLSEQANASPYADRGSQSHSVETVNMKRAPGEFPDEPEDLEDGNEGVKGKGNGKLSKEDLDDLETK